MIEACTEMWSKMIQYEGDGITLILFFASFIYLFLSNPKFRQMLGIPMLLLMALIFNPVLYIYLWTRLLATTYWRMFWMLGEGLFFSYALIDISGRIKNKYVKALPIIAGCIVIMIGGRYLYSGKVFSKADNYYKIPQRAIDMADTLLQRNENPTVVLPRSLYTYVRQYSNDIKMLYGRDVEGYTFSPSDGAVYLVRDELKKKKSDYATVSLVCHERKIDYIVIEPRKKIKFENYGYSLAEETEDFLIYENQWEDAVYTEWSVEKCDIGGETGLYRITDAYDRQMLLGGGSEESLEPIKNLLKNQKNAIRLWYVPGFDEKQEAFYHLINESDCVIPADKIWVSNVLDERVKAKIASYGTEEEKKRLESYEQVSMNYPIESPVEGDIYQSIGLTLLVLNNYRGLDQTESIREMCSMPVMMESASERILYVPYLSEYLVDKIIWVLPNHEIDLLIIGEDGDVDPVLKKELLDFFKPEQIMDETTKPGTVCKVKQ